MNSFSFNDAVRFRLLTQQEDTNAKIQVFIGVFLGTLLHWIYSIAVNVIKNQAPWCFGTWTTILIRLGVALVVTFFVFSGYWQKVKDQPASMRFWNALTYGITTDVLVNAWLPATVSGRTRGRPAVSRPPSNCAQRRGCMTMRSGAAKRPVQTCWIASEIFG